jgi:hypothetical protein
MFYTLESRSHRTQFPDNEPYDVTNNSGTARGSSRIALRHLLPPPAFWRLGVGHRVNNIQSIRPPLASPAP